jgi:hypothetical protein
LADANAIKKDGAVYWASGNAGTNSTGMSLIGTGHRDGGTGVSYYTNNCSVLWGVDDNISDYEKRMGMAVRILKV